MHINNTICDIQNVVGVIITTSAVSEPCVGSSITWHACLVGLILHMFACVFIISSARLWSLCTWYISLALVAL